VRRIGLLGGMSWVSTQHYYAAINRDVAARFGDEHCAPLVIWQEDFALIAERQRSGDWDGAGEILVGGGRALVASGAEVIGICANTMHLVADAVRDAIAPAILVHVVEVVRDRCLELDVRRVGLLGTQYTMSSPHLYPPTLAAADIEVLVPDEATQAAIHDHTYTELIRDVVTSQARSTFRTACASMIDRGADVIALACTEHAMVIGPDDADVPVIDSTTAHAAALVEAAVRN